MSLLESILYVEHNGNNLLIVSLYVDDLLVTGDESGLVEEFKQEMMQVFEMKDLGLQKLVDSLASVPNLSQVVKYSKVRVSNPHGFCLYLD